MRNRSGRQIVITERDLRIIRSVADCKALTGDQIRRHHRFGSTVRTNATLLRLVRHRCLRRQFQPTHVGTRRAVYILDRAGEQLVGRSRPQWTRPASYLFLSHQLLLNDIRFAFEDRNQDEYEFIAWSTEEMLREKHMGLVPDGFVEYAWRGALFSAFIEADRSTEGAKRFSQKISAYIDFAFSGNYRRIFERTFFRVLVITPDRNRTAALQRLIARTTTKIFWLTTGSDLLRDGPLAAIWRRPGSEIPHSLMEA